MRISRSLPWPAAIVAALGTACSLAPMPTPSPPAMTVQILVDVGAFGGPPELPPPYDVAGLSDDTFLLVIDRGAVQQLREVRWNGARWEPSAGAEVRAIPAWEEGPYLSTLVLDAADGFSTPATVLLGRVQNGPIARFEMTADGAIESVLVNQRPVFAFVFPPGTDIGADFVAFDMGTFELDRGQIHGE